MRILLVDDHALVVEGMRNFLTVNGFAVVGAAKGGAEALKLFAQTNPDLVLMDLQMGDLDGIQATKMIKEQYAEARIVMLTAIEDDDSLVAAMGAGAEGYLLKNMDPEKFLAQVNAIAAGEMPFAPGLAERLLRRMSRQSRKPEVPALDLTDRQTELLKLLAQGLTYKEIGTQMGITVATVRYHIKEILFKTGLPNRAQLLVNLSRLALDE